MSLHTVGSALVSPLSDPAGNIFTKAASSVLSLAACGDGVRGRSLGVDNALDGAHRGGGLLAVLLTLLDHVGLRQRDRRAADHRPGGKRTDHRCNQSLSHVHHPL